MTDLYQCLTDIAKAETTGDYDQALRTANKMIRRFPHEAIGHRCKLTALIQLGQFDDALAHIKKSGEDSFEKAYVQYRVSDNLGALETLEKLDSSEARVLELKAQIHYRLENFQEAFDLLKDVLRNHSDDYDEERKANLLAVQAQLQAAGAQQKVDSSALDSFEQYYNAACQEAEAERYDVALQYLNKAHALCSQTLRDEGLSEEEIEDELSMIQVQKAFVLHKKGDVEEARKLYDRVQKAGPSDASVKVTLANNQTAIESLSSGFTLAEARKRLKQALQSDQSKLSSGQKAALLINQAIVQLLSNQREPCRRTLEELAQKFGSSREARLVEAALLIKTDPDAALKVLEGSSIEERLAHAQIQIRSGRLEAAVVTLQSLPGSVKNRSGVVALLACVLLNAGKIDEASKIVQGSSIADLDLRRVLLDKVAQAYTEQNKHKQAVTVLEILAKLVPDDDSVKVNLIKAYGVVDPSKAEQLTASVFPEIELDGGNIEELEESDWILYGEKYKLKKEQKEVQDTEIVTGKLRAHKRKRKTILPKNYDPNVKPDPERWLPKQERSTWRAKKGRKHKDREIGRGTQGSMATNVEFKMDSPRSPQTSIPVEGPRLQKPAGAKAAKKKKKAGGKGW